MKLCKCGAIVDKNCKRCYPQTHGKTTKERGYGSDHKDASERYRAEHPLCECCVFDGGVIHARESKAMHHIVKVADDRSQRMIRSNWLALCDVCHELLEVDVGRARTVKQWSEQGYEVALCAS